MLPAYRARRIPVVLLLDCLPVLAYGFPAEPGRQPLAGEGGRCRFRRRGGAVAVVIRMGAGFVMGAGHQDTSMVI